MSEVEQFSITDPEVAKCPFAYYTAMRRERPVHRDPGTGIWWVARHDDVVKAALDVKAFSSVSAIVLKTRFRPRAQALWEAAGMHTIHTLVTADPPEHDEYRALGLQLFPPKVVEQLTPYIQTLVDELVDALASRREAEFVRDFAAKLPATVVCDEFGLPRADQPRFKTWTDAVIAMLSPDITEDREVELIQHLIELFKYSAAHIQKAATEMPGRVIHTLATMNKRDGTPFSSLERAWLLFTTFIGGNETTLNMLALGMRKLATNPQLQEQLRAEPAKIAGFVEEMLRLEGSVQSLLRVTTRDVELAGATIPKGANVALCTGSANRDDERWSAPDEFQLDRKGASRHLTFGYGRHSCIGIHLARRELNVAFTTLLRRLNDIRLCVPESQIQQVPLPFHRSIVSLPIRYRLTS
ncbi:MAG TPA: cytochrome P450 [Steroidobacteraceae bacterium]|nr:cytochrome P450 [Steroidobacteraceae bacterium]